MLTYTFDPDVTVHINAPSAADYDTNRPTRLIIFALPNGNTIAQTIGCQQAEGRDWHFYIQHIGAQTRYLRQMRTDCNIVVAYIEAGGRSWPTWRRTHADSGPKIVALIESIRRHVPAAKRVSLVAHSGGGSFIFGFINEMDSIPNWIERIVFLDANYAFSDADRHAEKLLEWLQASDDHSLGVICYDDRRIRYKGKLVLSPRGGTFRKTKVMVESFGWYLRLTTSRNDERTRWTALDGRLDFTAFENPDDKILHTVLVEKNGFLHAMTFGTDLANKGWQLMRDHAYDKWIQPEPTVVE